MPCVSKDNTSILEATATTVGLIITDPLPEVVRNGNPADCAIHGGGVALGPTVNSSGWYGGAYGCPASAVCFCTRYGDWEPGWKEPLVEEGAASPGGLTAVPAGTYFPLGCNGCVWGQPPRGCELAATSAAPDGLFVGEREMVQECLLHGPKYKAHYDHTGLAAASSAGGLVQTTYADELFPKPITPRSSELAAASSVGLATASEEEDVPRNGDPADCEIHSGRSLATVNTSGWYGGAYGCPASAVCFCTRYGDWEPGWQPRAAATASGNLEGNACRCGANRGADCDCWEDYFREEDNGGQEKSLATRSEPWDLCSVCKGPAIGYGTYSYGATGRTCGKDCWDKSNMPQCNGCKWGQPPDAPLPDGGAMLAAASAAPDGLFVGEREQISKCVVHGPEYDARYPLPGRRPCKFHSGGGLTYSTNSAGWCGGAYGGPAELFGCTC